MTEVLVDTQETLILLRVVLLDVETVIYDLNSGFVQSRADRYLRHDIFRAVEGEHLHTIAGQAVTIVIWRCKGIAENRITICQIRTHNADQRGVGGTIAVSGNKQSSILLSEILRIDVFTKPVRGR